MLLLFLSIFVQYDLLHCGDKANRKDEFMDYSITEFWWNSTPGIDQTDRITPQYSFLPTPKGWIMNADYETRYPREPSTPIEELETFYIFSDITRPPYPYEIENYTVTPSRPGRPEPWHVQYPGLTPPPNFPSDYKYPTIYPYTTVSAYIPTPTGPTPKRPSFTLPEVERPEFTFPTVPIPTKYPPGYVPEWVPSSTTPATEATTTSIWDPVGEHINKWKLQISSYAAADSRTSTTVVPMLSQVFNYDDTTEGVPEAIRRIPKVTQDAGSRQLKSSVFEDQTRPVLRENITVTERKGKRDSVLEDEASLYDPFKEPATMQRQNTDLLSVSIAKISDYRNIDDDDDIKKTTPRKNKRVMKMVDRSAAIPKREWRQSDPTATTTRTIVKEFFRQITVTQSYFQMIETLQEGYMMVFLIELTRLTATKESKAVRDVVKHADQIIHGFYKSGQLQWFGKPLIDVTTKVVRLLKGLKIDVIQNHAANLHQILSQRQQELSVEVNTILEYADMLYDDDEGKLLFDALKEFAAYPNISLTGYWLCNSLIHNFLRPYRRLKDTRKRQELMESVNFLLKSRLPLSAFNEEPPLRDRHVKQADSPPDEIIFLTQKEPVTQTEPHSDTTRSPRKRKRKRHHRSHKRKRERKRYTDTDLT